ncbi:MAG: FAD-binding and (Fe-S)-binding domain-containing protein [Candidatus Cyclobacteriaceae bacterium M3_2C_046]
MNITDNQLSHLAHQLEGELHFGRTMKILYATDASAYRELPLAVAIPANEEDIIKLIEFCHQHKTSLIPRTAGTSLAGQVVGQGIVVDVSRKFTRILELNQEEGWVKVQPGVIRDELNVYLQPHGLYFGPETSTANRAMIGGMVGNNSCGSNSIVYGSTRDHLLEVKALLSDGSEVVFKSLSQAEFEQKLQAENLLEQKIYQNIHQILTDKTNQGEIRKEFPKSSIHRRNTGYAIDLLLESAPFSATDQEFNFCKLIAGSEGTLAFITEIKLQVVPQPYEHGCLICAHFDSIDEALRANLVAVKHHPSASELIDQFILDCTKNNIEQRQNRFFIQGEPGAILVVEIERETPELMDQAAQAMIAEMKASGLGYHFPVLYGEDRKKIWNLRKSGLGLLSTMPGDAKPAPVIEDTAVDVSDLPAYIREFNLILKKYDLHCVHYAHAGSGELHLRPLLNLKTSEGHQLFRTILDEIAHLVKKYNGSLSGEHGDGRLRGEFIPFMIGSHNYGLLKQLKKAWDPENIFNPGKIVDTPPMNTKLRYQPDQITPQFATAFDFSYYNGIVRAAELCNGSGDCRKTELTGGTMCPSYMATRDEKDTTRARANILREMLTRSNKRNPFDHQEILEVMDLCLSCKGCKSECPSNVDIAKLKAEFLYQYYKSHPIPFRTRMIANISSANKLASLAPGFYNFLMGNDLTSSIFKNLAGFATERSIPSLYKVTLNKWFKKNRKRLQQNLNGNSKGKVILFNDEFSNYNDVLIGIKAIELLNSLGYQVEIPAHAESGRAFLSKGLLARAKEIANENIKIFSQLVNEQTPLIGLEPSAILTFRDEYLDLAFPEQVEPAQKIAENTFLIDEFLARETDLGHIVASSFKEDHCTIKLHGHCHQKALASLVPTKKILSLPKNYQVQLIPSGCCGMAGSFGYEAEHYDISMQIGELVLFPAVRKLGDDVLIAAPGTSCRHQIKDGTGKQALHPVEILWDALKA